MGHVDNKQETSLSILLFTTDQDIANLKKKLNFQPLIFSRQVIIIIHVLIINLYFDLYAE